MGTEVDVHLEYTIMPGLVTLLGGGWAFTGDGFQLSDITTGRALKVQDAWLLVNRLLYVF